MDSLFELIKRVCPSMNHGVLSISGILRRRLSWIIGKIARELHICALVQSTTFYNL